MTVVLDASAVLAMLLDEPGRQVVEAQWDGSVIASPNMAEVVSILSDRGFGEAELDKARAVLRPHVAPFGAREAELAGLMRGATRTLGLSLGDRACLATALVLGLPVLTADRAWAGLDIGVAIQLIR